MVGIDLFLKGKAAVVTGGTRGIGLAICRALLGEGARVALCGRGQRDLDGALLDLAGRGDVFGAVADVTKADELKAFIDLAAGRFGGLDVLVNNVGGSSGGKLLESTDEDWFRTFDLNIFHSVRASRAAIPHMKTGGSIIIISSISGWKPAPKAQYGSAKAAEMFLSSALAMELAEQRIRVNTVCPGSIMFPGGGWDRYQKNNPEGYERFVKGDFPMGRLGKPEEIADVVAFLASERSNWINGASLAVDGAQIKPSAFWL